MKNKSRVEVWSVHSDLGSWRFRFRPRLGKRRKLAKLSFLREREELKKEKERLKRERLKSKIKPPCTVLPRVGWWLSEIEASEGACS